jgi:hypothetical protein
MEQTTIDAVLTDLAERALATAQEQMKERGKLDPIILLRDKHGDVFPLPLPGEMGNIMNSGAGKDFLFGAIRSMVKKRALTGVVIVTEAWFGRSTPKGAAMSQEEFTRISAKETGFAAALREGLITRCEIIMISVQTPQGCLMVRQEFERDDDARRVTFGAIERMPMGVDEFRGRQKMFGALREEYINE